jgi:PPK2 family polyphosphate:nucleotide phosphotransferase
MPKQPLVPPFDKKVHLKDYDPAYTGGFDDEDAVKAQLEKDIERLIDLQELLYAGAERSVLIVIQAMDTGGKDGLIKHVFRGLNPAGVAVTSFKRPSEEELAHDFLWRIHQHVPRKGMIGVFNRSHYEDVLVVRVHNLVPKSLWKRRYDQINEFEELVHENGTVILKFFLHISKDEQKRRLEDRLNEPHKHWKFNPGDLKERERWDDYMEAYEAALSKCHTEHAPWHIVPANHKWYRNYVVTKTIVDAMEAIDLKYPPAAEGIGGVVIPD